MKERAITMDPEDLRTEKLREKRRLKRQRKAKRKKERAAENAEVDFINRLLNRKKRFASQDVIEGKMW